jgi:hypothetical protein
MQYYPIQARWRRIKPHISDARVQATLVRDFNKFTFGRWKQPFTAGMKPTEFESCDWRCETRRGRQPEFWDYVKHSACHWLVGFNLRLAELVEPKRAWRIVTSDAHSTTWDGDTTLFDFNFLALGIAPDEAWRLASEGGTVMPIGKPIRVYMARHYSRG